MSNTIATNASANSAVSYLQRNSAAQSSSISKLSSGSRIVKASDDAASLAVGTKLKADVTALNQASTNADQAASLMQIADGAMSRVGDTLMRMKSLATQARSDVLSSTERGYINEEYQELMRHIDYVASSTKFNDISVADGSLGSDIDLGSSFGMAEAGFGEVGSFTEANGVTFSALSGFKNDVDSQWTVDYTDNGSGNPGDVTITNANDPTQTQTLQVSSGDTTTEDLDFTDLGIRVSFNAADTDFTSGGGLADIAAGTLSYEGGDTGITFETTGAVADGTTFSVDVSAAGGTNTVTLTNETTGGTQSIDFAEGSATNTELDFDAMGIKMNIKDYDTTAAAFQGFDGNGGPDPAEQFTVDKGSATFQIGVEAGADDLVVNIASMTTQSLGVANTDVTDLTKAETASAAVDKAIAEVNQSRANLGANMSRVEKVNENLSTTIENLDAARSTLMDVDVAAEMTKFSTNQVQTQAATAMLAQANQLPQNLMRLLQ